MVEPADVPSCGTGFFCFVFDSFLISQIADNQRVAFSVTSGNLREEPVEAVYGGEKGENFSAEHHPADGVRAGGI